MPLPFLIPAAVQIAAQVLPSLVGRIGGDRAEEVAKNVVDTAKTVAGVKSDDPREILAALEAKDERKAELQAELARIEQLEAERVIEDRVSARERDRALREAGGGNARATAMLILSFLGLVGCVGSAVVLAPQLGNAEIGLLTTVAGVLLKMLSDAFAFEFGSSRGSKNKEAMLGEFQRSLAAVAADRAAEPKPTTPVVDGKPGVELTTTDVSSEPLSKRLREGRV